ncbi:hypothetical protein QBL02_00990 [Leucobacter sp. UT-8R-CII-1-4]|uniref:hypothetical protein n=1 Tax=Leucobacter sp. UT-8R-CII-1-4 TaxID=3040075 RepID=UPI0024A8948F|nr:hypothetical protein [Leucobacter sp. UT-8R-CII-1-4]MDI6022114.1 hypothetical protein [Leucobacter sp. UT-8R-CII-1-4]
MNEAQRQQAWARIHETGVSTQELNYLAGLYPEFLPTISAHPNYVPALPQQAVETTAATPAGAVPAGQAGHSAPTSISDPRLNVPAVCALLVAALGALFNFFVPFIIDVLVNTNSIAAIDLAINAPMLCVAIVTAVLAGLALRPSSPARGRWAAIAAFGASGFQVLAIVAQTAGTASFDALHYF